MLIRSMLGLVLTHFLAAPHPSYKLKEIEFPLIDVDNRMNIIYASENVVIFINNIQLQGIY